MCFAPQCNHRRTPPSPLTFWGKQTLGYPLPSCLATLVMSLLLLPCSGSPLPPPTLPLSSLVTGCTPFMALGFAPTTSMSPLVPGPGPIPVRLALPRSVVTILSPLLLLGGEVCYLIPIRLLLEKQRWRVDVAHLKTLCSVPSPRIILPWVLPIPQCTIHTSPINHQRNINPGLVPKRICPWEVTAHTTAKGTAVGATVGKTPCPICGIRLPNPVPS